MSLYLAQQVPSPPHITEGETEAQRGDDTFPRAHSQLEQSQGAGVWLQGVTNTARTGTLVADTGQSQEGEWALGERGGAGFQKYPQRQSDTRFC